MYYLSNHDQDSSDVISFRISISDSLKNFCSKSRNHNFKKAYISSPKKKKSECNPLKISVELIKFKNKVEYNSL